MTYHSRIARILSTFALAAALLAGCGDKKFTSVDRGSSAAAKVLAAAPAKTRAARTARMKLSLKANGRPILDASGVTRLDRELARLRFKFGVAVEGLPAGTAMIAVLEEDYVYVRLPDRPTWARVSLKGDDATFSTGVSQSLGYLGAVTGNAKRAGEASIHGSQARLYSATVDLNRVADNLPVGERDAYRKKLVKESLPRRLPLKVAIDAQGRIARMNYRTRVQGVDVEANFELWDYGAKGDFSVPDHFIRAAG